MAKKKTSRAKPMASGNGSDAATPSQDPSMTTDENSSPETDTAEDTAPVTEAPVESTETEETAAPAPAPTPAPAPPSYQQTPVEDAVLKGFQDRLEAYCKAMAKGVPVNALVGSQQQLALYRLILDILRQDGSLFTKAWSNLLTGVFEQRAGCFNDLYAFRFINEIKALTKPEIRIFMNLLHLIRLTADRKGRLQALKAVDFQSVTANIPVPNAADKLHGFYYAA